MTRRGVINDTLKSNSSSTFMYILYKLHLSKVRQLAYFTYLVTVSVTVYVALIYSFITFCVLFIFALLYIEHPTWIGVDKYMNINWVCVLHHLFQTPTLFCLHILWRWPLTVLRSARSRSHGLDINMKSLFINVLMFRKIKITYCSIWSLSLF